MTRGWRAVEWLSRVLEPDERDAVCGDLLEARAALPRALIDVAGLVCRRQAALWLEWRPWLAMITIVIPLGFLLSVSSRFFADGSTHDLFLYVQTGDWAYFSVPGWRRDVLAAFTRSSLSFLALAAWSWTAGFVLGRVSGRAAWAAAVLFCLFVAFGTIGTTTTMRSHRHSESSRMIFSVYSTAVVRLLLVMWPARRGLRRSVTIDALPRLRAYALVVAVAVLTASIAKGLEGSLTYGWGLLLPQPGPDGIFGTADDLRPLWWVSLVIMWPAAFIAVRNASNRARSGDGSPSCG